MIFSVNVEDWSQSVLNRNNPITRRVWDNTVHILDLLDKYNTKATFFIQGSVAKTYPVLVEKIHLSGHEVACSSYSHKSIENMHPNEFEQEMDRTIKTIQDAISTHIIGFRAPDFSIHPNIFSWYCRILHQHGIRYDSSLFQIPVSYYGIEYKYPLAIFEAYGIQPFYLSHTQCLNQSFPFFGGRYFKHQPYWFTRWKSAQLLENSVFYMHTYDIDTGEYHALKKSLGLSLSQRLIHFRQRHTVVKKLNKLLNQYYFTTFKAHYFSSEHATTSNHQGLDSRHTGHRL